MPTAFITGGTKRIGFHIAVAFAKKGYDLILHDHTDTSHRDDILKHLKGIPINISFVNADLLEQDQIHNMCQEVANICGVHNAHNIPDIIIHTASLFEKDDIKNFDRTSWNNHLNIHALAPLEITQFFAKKISYAPDVKMNSIALIDQRVQHPNPDFFSYTASKMLIANLIKTSAMALAPQIRINGISPGPTLRNIRQSEQDFELQAKLTPLEHAVSPEEIANTCIFLCESPSITGQIITIDSGQSLDWRTKSYLKVNE